MASERNHLQSLISPWSLQAGEENPAVYLSVVSLHGPLHTVVMKKPDDPRIGWVTNCRIVREAISTKIVPWAFSKTTRGMTLAFCFSRREYYITMVKWATNTKLAVNWLNRAQNNSILTLCEATTGVCIKVTQSVRISASIYVASKHFCGDIEK